MEIEWMMMQYNSRPPVSSLIPQWDQQKAKTHTRDTICHSDGAHSSSHCSSRVQQRQRQPNRPSLKIDTVMHVTNQMNRLWRLGSTPSSLQRKIWKNSFLFYFFRSLFDFLKKIPERGKGSYLLLLLSSSSSHPPPSISDIFFWLGRPQRQCSNYVSSHDDQCGGTTWTHFMHVVVQRTGTGEKKNIYKMINFRQKMKGERRTVSKGGYYRRQRSTQRERPGRTVMIL